MNETLQDFPPGMEAVIVAIQADDDERNRLESLGILPGVEVCVLTNNNGDVLAAVGDNRVMLERKAAAAVIII